MGKKYKRYWRFANVHPGDKVLYCTAHLGGARYHVEVEAVSATLMTLKGGGVFHRKDGRERGYKPGEECDVLIPLPRKEQ